jgi:hypothetical protein
VLFKNLEKKKKEEDGKKFKVEKERKKNTLFEIMLKI